MDSKHFSHHHELCSYQVSQIFETQCSGCKSSGSGHFYVCWPCRYFLHDQCFRAPRSLNHPAHPLHPLTLVPSPTYPSGYFACNSCSLAGDGFSYTCSACEFDIHPHCALTPDPNPHVNPSPLPAPNSFISRPQISIPNSPAIPNFAANPPPLPLRPRLSRPISTQSNNSATIFNHFSHPHALKAIEIKQKNGKLCSACEWELSGTVYCCTESNCSFSIDKACFDCPREIRHRSHPQHPLTLLSAPPNGRKFDCFACYRSGKAYVYTCPTCSYIIHIDCVDWRETQTRPDHKHPLKLYFSPAEVGGREGSITCNVCVKPVDERAWLYYCRECSFGTHTSCVGCQAKV